jgi:hypothetical protein
MPTVSLFTCPKSFAEDHIALIQHNAIRSWLQLGSDVEVLLIGDDPGVEEIAKELEIPNPRELTRNLEGTPQISSIFEIARSHGTSPLLCYVNADIILLPDFLTAVEAIGLQLEKFLMVGQRWDLRVAEPLEFSDGWDSRLRTSLQTHGHMHPPAGSDYFAFPRALQLDIPDFALGRAGWDNWMIFAARASGAPVVEASGMVTAVHQEHEYEHLPDGRPHHALPESHRNVELAGGREMMFTLRDSTMRLDRSGLSPISPWETGLLRWLESAAIARLGPGSFARFARMLMNPGESLVYFGGRIRRMFGRSKSILI